MESFFFFFFFFRILMGFKIPWHLVAIFKCRQPNICLILRMCIMQPYSTLAGWWFRKGILPEKDQTLEMKVDFLLLDDEAPLNST